MVFWQHCDTAIAKISRLDKNFPDVATAMITADSIFCRVDQTSEWNVKYTESQVTKKSKPIIANQNCYQL